jgi:hypothetical protein
MYLQNSWKIFLSLTRGVAWLPIGRTSNKSTNPELTELALKTNSLGDLLETDKGGGLASYWSNKEQIDQSLTNRARTEDLQSSKPS